jgi:hypothetical protein
MTDLPDPTTPLRLADGRLVYPGGRIEEPERFVEVPTNAEAQRIVVNARRKLSDLPELPKTMNAIGVVLSYTLFGLDDIEIAIATGFTEDQVGRIKLNDAYTSMHDTVTRSILAAETDTVRDLFQQHARDAAGVMIDAIKNGRRAERMVAAKDLLDRAGHRPSDVVEHRHRMDGGLVIEIVRRDTTPSSPLIDMEVPDGVRGQS